MKPLIDYKNYQAWLLDYFQQKRGNQSRLSESLNCRSSFLTQIVDEKVHLSMDQALKTADFLGLTKTEKLTLTLMVQKEKITEPQGKKFFDEQLQKIKAQKKTVKERLESIDELAEEAKAQYYSSWLYGAVHILVAFSWIENEEQLARHLKIEKQVVAGCVQFLVEQGLIEIKNRVLQIGKRQIHLGNESKHIFAHHTS